MSGGFNPISMVSQAALAFATGGTSLIAQLATQVVSQLAKQLISQLGQQLGLPPAIVNGALGAFDMAMGNAGGAAATLGQTAAETVSSFSRENNLSPQEEGELQGIRQNSEDQIMQMVKNARGADEDGNPTGVNAGRSKIAGGSWLMALAKALGAQLNAAQNELERTMDGTNWKKADQVAEFQAQSQQFALFMNTATNVIKTVGEALTTMARKQ